MGWLLRTRQIAGTCYWQKTKPISTGDGRGATFQDGGILTGDFPALWMPDLSSSNGPQLSP